MVSKQFKSKKKKKKKKMNHKYLFYLILPYKAIFKTKFYYLIKNSWKNIIYLLYLYKIINNK